MAYDFLGLVNEVNRRLNEVELTSSNFATATGYYSTAKDAVNSSVRHINHEEFEWPWNHVEEEDTLTVGTTRYGYPYDVKTINMDSFRIKHNDTLNVNTTKLKNLAYQEYLDKYVDYEYNTSDKPFLVTLYVHQVKSLSQFLPQIKHMNLYMNTTATQ